MEFVVAKLVGYRSTVMDDPQWTLPDLTDDIEILDQLQPDMDQPSTSDTSAATNKS